MFTNVRRRIPGLGSLVTVGAVMALWVAVTGAMWMTWLARHLDTPAP